MHRPAQCARDPAGQPVVAAADAECLRARIGQVLGQLVALGDEESGDLPRLDRVVVADGGVADEHSRARAETEVIEHVGCRSAVERPPTRVAGADMPGKSLHAAVEPVGFVLHAAVEGDAESPPVPGDVGCPGKVAPLLTNVLEPQAEAPDVMPHRRVDRVDVLAARLGVLAVGKAHRVHAPAHSVASLENHHIEAAAPQFVGCRQACEPGAYDDNAPTPRCGREKPGAPRNSQPAGRAGGQQSAAS